MSDSFDLLMTMYRDGLTDQFVDHARRCLKAKALSKEESVAIARLLPSVKFNTLAQANQVVCLVYLNRTGATEEVLAQETGLPRELIAKAVAGKSYSMKVAEAVLKALDRATPSAGASE